MSDTSITTTTTQHAVVADLPDALPLGPQGRLYLLSWLHASVVCGIPITPDEWRTAWGNAADYQTVVDAKAVLS